MRTTTLGITDGASGTTRISDAVPQRRRHDEVARSGLTAAAVGIETQDDIERTRSGETRANLCAVTKANIVVE